MAKSSPSSLLMHNEKSTTSSSKKDYGSSAANHDSEHAELIVSDPNKLAPLDMSAFSLRDTEGSSLYKQTKSSKKKKKKKSSWRQTLAAVAGNVLEWYDFALFGYFSDVIGGVFFPADQPGHAAIIESFIVFGGAFLMRPIGGMVMGYIGDVYGTKVALVLSIFLMALPTTIMGLLPGYQSIGPWAPVILILIRLLQGLSVGGQFMSSMVYTLQNHPYQSWGFYGSLVMATGCIGTMLGGIAGFIIRQLFDDEQVSRFGWRIPFLMGFLVCISGFYLRSHSYESEEDQAASSATKKENPLQVAFSAQNCPKMLAAIMVVMVWSGGYYLTFVWMAVYMADLIDPPIPYSFGIASIASLISCSFFFCYAGHLSDLYGRKIIMIMGGVSLGISAPVLIKIIRHSDGNPWISMVALTTQGIFLALWGAPMCSWLVETFDERARLTSVATGYNLAHAIAGGFSPSIATILVDKKGPDAPGLIITVLSLISLFGLLVVAPKTPQQPPRILLDKKESFQIVPDAEEQKQLGGDE